MKRFDWDEFKNKDNKIAVHCKTEEEAIDFCKQMHGHGMRWNSGRSYLEKTNYEEYREKTCYAAGNYATYQCCKVGGYKILEWSDYMNKNFTKAELKSGMAVECRDKSYGRRLVVGDMLIGETGYSTLEEYNHVLTLTDGSEYDELDIVKVYEIKNACLFKSIMYDDNLELIWERKEPKKMTVEEMRKKLEELTGEEIEVTA